MASQTIIKSLKEPICKNLYKYNGRIPKKEYHKYDNGCTGKIRVHDGEASPTETLLDKSKDPFKGFSLHSCGKCEGYLYLVTKEEINYIKRFLDAEIKIGNG